jgi:hypothetical protein
MCRQIGHLIVWAVLLMALTHGSMAYAFNPNTDPSLAGFWKLDETSGTVAVDSSTGGHNGGGTWPGSVGAAIGPRVWPADEQENKPAVGGP